MILATPVYWRVNAAIFKSNEQLSEREFLKRTTLKKGVGM